VDCTRPHCVRRGVVTHTGDREEAVSENNSHRAQPGAKVNYIDSGGLGPLVALRTTAQNAGGTIKLTNLTKRVGDLLQVTKLLTVFDVINSRGGSHRILPEGRLIRGREVGLMNRGS